MAKKGRRASERRKERGGPDEADIAGGMTQEGQVPGDSLFGEDDDPDTGMSAQEARAPTRGHRFDSEAPTSAHLMEPGAATAINAADKMRSGLEQREKTSVGDAYNLALQADATQEARRQEATVLQQLPEQGERNLGKLKILKGEGAGQTIELNTTPVLVGRDDDCAVILEDTTISRHHVELYFDEDDGQWIAEDLGSGSGTLVGGKAIELPTPIRHGDVLTVGRTEMRFFYAEGRPVYREPAPEEEVKEKTSLTALGRLRGGNQGEKTGIKLPAFKKKEKAPDKDRGDGGKRFPVVAVLIGLAIVSILVGGSLFAVKWVNKQTAVDPKIIDNQVASLLDDARRLIKDKKLDDAMARAETVLALDKENVDVQSLMRTIRTERDVAVALTEARAALKKGDPDAAMNALGKIPDSSIFADERDGLKGRVEERIRKGRLEAIEKRMADKDWDGAEAALEKFLKDYPEDVAAQALQERILEIRNAKPPTHASIKEARKLFAQGQVSRARAVVEMHANQGVGQAKRYLTDLDTFDTSRAAGNAALKAKKGPAAAAAYEKAYSLLAPLSGGSGGALMRQLGKSYGDALYLKGVALMQKGNDCGAARALWRAKRVSGKDAKIRAQTKRLSNKARGVVERAKGKSASDPAGAKAMAKAAQCLVPASSPEGRQLQRLARGR